MVSEIYGLFILVLIFLPNRFLSSMARTRSGRSTPAAATCTHKPPINCDSSHSVFELNERNVSSNNPFYLSNVGHLGTGITTNVLQGSSNYNAWCCTIKLSMVTKNKMGFVLDTIPLPSINDPCYNSWTQCNSMVMSWLINSISPQIATSIIYQERAYSMWQDLHGRFHQSNGHRIFQLKQSIANNQ
ncbi:uncharacterized protein LOC133795631 [Humulus lupulus]|uniref:uncharacterized protein LOC133795631 n=1 Tax=Humulus lupulus TaxID=3486 RepID=UPI002B402CFC|nr:uncharacterized protein LOC133795631 [Humulus lupulus]